MQTVTIEKERLRKIITENRARHITEYDEVMEDYRKEYEKRLVQKLEQLRDIEQELPDTYFRNMPQPESHVADYDEVLDMLDFSVDDTIELTRDDFSRYVRDDWGWKHTFNSTKMSYNNG